MAGKKLEKDTVMVGQLVQDVGEDLGDVGG